ncbi:MAG: hypothetical protein SOY60_10320 [Fusobacterium gastrosuis]|nr:hypothetical protein [Fusobacterium gastrosuis]
MEKNNDNYRNSFNDAEAIKEYRKQLKNIKRLAKEIKEKPKSRLLSFFKK